MQVIPMKKEQMLLMIIGVALPWPELVKKNKYIVVKRLTLNMTSNIL